MMKGINIITVIFFFISIGLFSCSDNIEENPNTGGNTDEGIPVSYDLSTKSLPAGLQCTMYIFWKNTGDSDYTLKDSLSILSGNNTRIKFNNNDLVNKSYRFIFIATPLVKEVQLLNKNTNNLAYGDLSGNIMIRSLTQQLTGDNYYQITDMTSQEILRNGKINATLWRMVGQMVADIYKVEDNDINNITNVSSKVNSVLDRVYQIDIYSEGATRDAYFDTSNPDTVIIKGLNKWTTGLTESITGVVMSDSLRVSIPQGHQRFEVPPIESATKDGSVRIRGSYGLPSDKGVRYNLKFHYYDTTPACGDTAKIHNHYINADACFTKNTIEVNLPKKVNPANLLDIFANYYTVNKIGIRFDRIIDLEMSAGFGFDYIWENEK